jgi:hypothetical protein
MQPKKKLSLNRETTKNLKVKTALQAGGSCLAPSILEPNKCLQEI